jgi:hypothetical protein
VTLFHIGKTYLKIDLTELYKYEVIGPLLSPKLSGVVITHGIGNNYKIWKACFSKVEPTTTRSFPEFSPP